jgi:dTDP-4-amino-4,6-dideoxygalactose transaminase
MIPVTKAFLPPLEEYNQQLKRVWENQWLTNRGKLVKELESTLKDYLGVPYVLATNNGTIPLQIALKLYGGNSEIITTPFSYVATTAAIVWENCKPVFVDIDAEHLTIDERRIEAAITPRTKAILATHVFGNPCAVAEIGEIAARHGLKVIYDAAHAFGTSYQGKALLSYGDISTCSFHATKLFHTAEGGAFCCKDESLYWELFHLHNFGHKSPLEFYGLGINGKMSEIQAAMGLAVFPYLATLIGKRKVLIEEYLKCLDLDRLQVLKIREGTDWNYSYFPVIFSSEQQLLAVQEALAKEDIHPRRYFYPSLNTINYVHGPSMPVSESIAERIMCLPLYSDLPKEKVTQIAEIINTSISK